MKKEIRGSDDWETGEFENSPNELEENDFMFEEPNLFED